MKRWIIGGLVLLVGIALFTQRVVLKDYFISFTKAPVPLALPYEDIGSRQKEPLVAPPGLRPDRAGSVSDTNEEVSKAPVEPTPSPDTPAEINLAVPFQAQAPFANWVEPYKEACEEASLIMVDYYLRGLQLSREQMQKEIDAQVTWQEENWGGHYDLPAEKVVELGKAFYDYSFEIIPDLTIEKIKRELRAGQPVIVPAAGRELGNPNFRTPGPLYHMLVIKGYTRDGKFITNDPGTRKGADYLYDPEVLLAAIRDWDGDSPDGPKVGFTMYK